MAKKVVKKRSGADPFPKVVEQMLRLLGENPKREGLLRTPVRVAESLRYLTEGYRTDPKEILHEAVFREPYDEMVIVKDIEIFSLCEHHLIPFYGKAHVAYIPNGKVVGLSKIPRLVEVFSRRLQIQERLTTQVAECLMSVLKPKGVAVVIEALHLCMCMRGVKKGDAYTVTSSMLGAFRRDARSRSEFLSLVRLKREE
jgi:GTP cyclohydrolase I